MSDNDGNPPYGTVDREYGMRLAMTAELRSALQFAQRTAGLELPL